MLTTMTDADGRLFCRCLRASRSRRGDKGRDDRKFLEALHYFAVHNITWRALPERIRALEQRVETVLAIEPDPGPSKPSSMRWRRMSETAHLVQMFDSTVVRAHVSAAGAKGGKTIRRSAARAAASRRKST